MNVNIVCVGRALCVLYAGSGFMIEYILPSRILFSRSIARLRSASIWRGRSAVGLSESRSWQASGAEGVGGGRREAARRGHGHLHALRIVLHVRVLLGRAHVYSRFHFAQFVDVRQLPSLQLAERGGLVADFHMLSRRRQRVGAELLRAARGHLRPRVHGGVSHDASCSRTKPPSPRNDWRPSLRGGKAEPKPF